MAKIPENVNEWSRGILVDLLDEGYDEDLRLEFKSKIDSNTKRIPITACAFANTKGGFLVFGIDNDRKKNIEQRLVGLDDSDQLKSQINNQIRTIKPSIPIDNIEFKESNISLPNGNVIVVLKISKTLVSPHQFQEIFYKRVANGNAPMDVEEIKNAIIESQKSSRMLYLLKEEERLVMDILNAMKIYHENDKFETAINLVRHLNYATFTHFLYNQSHFYSMEIQESSFMLVRQLDRLERNGQVARSKIDSNESIDESKDIFKSNVSSCIKGVEKINQQLGITYEERVNGFLDGAKEEIKSKMAEMIKKKTPSIEKTKDSTS